MVQWEEQAHRRLSDRVLEALDLSISQKDIEISEMLINVLDLSMTRGAGGADFVERRDYTEKYEAIVERFNTLKTTHG